MLRDLVKTQNDLICILRDEVARRGELVSTLQQQIQSRREANNERMRRHRLGKTG